MAKKTIFGFVQLDITSDGKDYNQVTVHEVTVKEGKENEGLEKFAEGLALNFTDEGEETEDGYEHHNGEVLITVNTAKVITLDEYAVLKKFIGHF